MIIYCSNETNLLCRCSPSLLALARPALRARLLPWIAAVPGAARQFGELASQTCASAVAQLRQRSRAAAVAGQARRELEGQSSCINNTNILNFKLQKLIFKNNFRFT